MAYKRLSESLGVKVKKILEIKKSLKRFFEKLTVIFGTKPPEDYKSA